MCYVIGIQISGLCSCLVVSKLAEIYLRIDKKFFFIYIYTHAKLLERRVICENRPNSLKTNVKNARIVYNFFFKPCIYSREEFIVYAYKNGYFSPCSSRASYRISIFALARKCIQSLYTVATIGGREAGSLICMIAGHVVYLRERERIGPASIIRIYYISRKTDSGVRGTRTRDESGNDGRRFFTTVCEGITSR